MLAINHCIFIVFLIGFYSFLLTTITTPSVDAQIEVCHANCLSADRISGPTKVDQSLDHPYAKAVTPMPYTEFCKIGCQFFLVDVPKNTTCKNLCAYVYDYSVTTGYNDFMEQSTKECQDGCDIAVQVCEPGFYCNNGEMRECEAGTYRSSIDDVSIVSLRSTSKCKLCPQGRYRSATNGKRQEDCAKCPKGKFLDTLGSVQVSDCKRCPAGKNAEQEGMALCKEICLGGSCTMTDKVTGEVYFDDNGPNGNIDFYRETIPYIGRH